MKLFSSEIALAVLGVDDHILYACKCGEFKPITKLYFCRHCTKLRCSKCVTHEVDSFYCPNCLENMPSAEAKLKKNRCANCFDCPSCGHTLSVRATVVQSPTSNPLEDPKAPPKKVHYLTCGFCRWTTRDIGLPDQISPSGGWPDKEYPFAKKITSLLDSYKQITHQDKLQKERLKLSKRRTNLYLMDRYGYSLSLGKKRTSFSGSPISASLQSKLGSSPKQSIEIPQAYTVIEDPEPISDSLYNDPVHLEEVLTIEQRLSDAALQPSTCSELYPKHKSLMVRRSYRCKECEHNLCKPEFNPSSIKFKLQLFAIQYCPSLQVVQVGKLVTGQETKCVLSLTNPLDAIMTISFQQMQEEDLGFDQKTAAISLPSIALPLAAKDATVEFDGIGSDSPEQFNDDPEVIHSRGSNKLCFYCHVTPNEECEEVKVAFKLRYEYKMIIAPFIIKREDETQQASKPEEQLLTLDINVIANLGRIEKA